MKMLHSSLGLVKRPDAGGVMETLSILDLIGKHCGAIRNRGSADASFSLLVHLRDPRAYYPNTPGRTIGLG